MLHGHKKVQIINSGGVRARMGREGAREFIQVVIPLTGVNEVFSQKCDAIEQENALEVVVQRSCLLIIH